MIFTRTSCNTIINQKKERTYPGSNALTIDGRNIVSNAAKIQGVKLPSDCPWARWQLAAMVQPPPIDDAPRNRTAAHRRVITHGKR